MKVSGLSVQPALARRFTFYVTHSIEKEECRICMAHVNQVWARGFRTNK